LTVLIQSEEITKNSDKNKVAELQAVQASISKQNYKVRAQLNAIHKAVVPQHYLPESILPFQVEGLSFWNGQPMVTIAMTGINGQHFFKLIGQGNEYSCSTHNHRQNGCTSWTVKSIHVNTGVVIFEDHHGQHVRVSL